VSAVHGVPGAGHEKWTQEGKLNAVRVGGLSIEGLAKDDAEEFFTGRMVIQAARAVPSDHALTSIILLTHNELAYTRLCIDSIQRLTDEPYELIVVDNASTDGTVTYLQSLQDVRLILNQTNVGFPAGANQGMRAAQGQQILLLNNDTVVTTGWLGRLLGALASAPDIGMIGPCSNCVSGEQQVPVPYDDLVGLDGFAWDWGKAHNKQVIETDRLVGFCLLIRRAPMERVGFLDERFGIGCFEDDDYAQRMLRAGYRLVIACDAFVHHFGGRTFVGSGIDFAGLMAQNEKLFRAKWSAESLSAAKGKPLHVAAGSKTPSRSDHPDHAACDGRAVAARRFTLRVAPGGGLLLERTTVDLSLCMIVRDNARTLEACLASIKPWVDEMVVVDTGSKDQTPAIAQRLGARVFHTPWPDSFGAARNESLSHARGRWIFWMDSDDTISPENGRKLRELISNAAPSIMGYVMQVRCPEKDAMETDDYTEVTHVKLFRNLPQIRFERRIHEQIIPAIRRAGGEVAWSDVFVVHSGYDHSPEGQQKKLDRDLRLLHLELEEQPEHPFTLFNLGMTYADAARYDQAIDYLRRSIRQSGDGDSHLRKAYALLAGTYGLANRRQEAWEACQQGLQLFPSDDELRFRRGVLLHELGRLPEAVDSYEDLLKRGETPYFRSVRKGIRGYLARHNLALVYRDLGDAAREEEQWRLVVAEVPNYRPGWRGLGETLMRQGKREETQRVADLLVECRHLRAEGLLLSSQVAASHGNLDVARQELSRAVQEFPEDPEVREAWCRFLFEHGQPSEAEVALREQLRREPDNAAACHNLGLIALRLEHPQDAIEWFRQSLRLRPEHAPTHWELGNALQAVGRRQEAAAQFEGVLRLDPTHASAGDSLRRMREIPATSTSRTHVPDMPTQHVIQLPGRSVEVRCMTRGPVDSAILREVLERDVYGVREVNDAPSLVVDLGAHIGGFSILAASAWPSARIIACEADPENFALLKRNLAGLRNVESIQAAVVAENVSEIEFNMVVDKAAHNSGGGSCVRDEPGTVKRRVPALSVEKLWNQRSLGVCNLLKLDCEGCEVQILRALAKARLLKGIQLIVGEWHAPDERPATTACVRQELTAILQDTHAVQFYPPFRGREGHFRARVFATARAVEGQTPPGPHRNVALASAGRID
jgi:FkbM family methyltransferase